MSTRRKEFGVFSAAMCCAAAFAATPELPVATNGVITLAGEYTLTEADAEAITNVTQFTLSGASSRIVFDLSEGASLHVSALISGDGKIVKRGKGALCLDNNTVNAAYKVTNGLLIEDGELHLPEQSASSKTSDHNAIELNAPGVLFLTGSDTYNGCRTVVNLLSGDGLITNAWAKNQTIQTNPGTSDFYGKINCKLDNIYVYPSSTLNLRGTNSTFTTALQSFGTIGLVKVGYDASAPSSMGCNGTLSLIPNGGTDYGRFVYLGEGESTVKTLAFNKWNSANAMTADGGVTGGLVWNGPITVSENKGVMNSVIFAGEHTNACEVGGSWAEPAGGATYVTKKGSGTWLFRHHASRAMKGVVDVKEGTLKFESLAEKGAVCSLGRSTLTCWNVLGGAFTNDVHRVPYAFVLGGGTKGEATLECIGRASVTNADAAAERPLVLAGAGRLKTSGVWPFSLKGVSSIAATPCTLTLDGTNTLSSLSTVTNGASALSVIKEGAGTWTLRGALDFSGTLAVKAGTLVIEGPDTPYSLFRLSINFINSNFNGLTDTCIGGTEFALYDADGIRRNVALDVPASTVAPAITLLPGEASIDEPLSKIVVPSWFTNTSLWLRNFFDENGGSTFYTATTYGAPSYANTSSWVTVSMRLAAGSPAITSYDLMCVAGNTRRVWGYEVRGSTDGVMWDLLDEKGTNDCKQVTGQVWYSDGSSTVTNARHGFAIAPTPAYVEQLARVAGVSVAPGATLKAKGTVTLPALTLDCANGNGTLDGFAFADSGVVNLVNFTPSAGAQNVPITFANTDEAELAKVSGRNWAVSVDGVVTPSKRVSLSATHATIYTVGTMVLVQ